MIWMFFASVIFSLFYSCDGNSTEVNLDANNPFYTIYTPGYPSNYPKGITLSWMISAPEGTQVNIYCPQIEIKPSRCRNAYVSFNDGQPFCNGPVSDSTDANTLTVNFISHKRRKHVASGFICTVSYFPSDVQNNINNSSTDSSSGGKIVGGTATPITDIPFQVILLTSYSIFQFCGGSLISELYVVTAAHCVHRNSRENIIVALGVDEKSYSGNNLIAIKEIIVHESYSAYTLQNDIALLKLVSPIKFSSTMQPIALADVPIMEQMAMPGDKAVVSGFGTLEYKGDTSYNLQSVEIPIVANTTCAEAYGSDLYTTEMICAGETGKDSCQGDSGGPLFVSDSSGENLIGVVSWGIKCASEGYPGVYTRVSTYKTWVETKINV